MDQSVTVDPRGNFGFPGGLPWQCVRPFKNIVKAHHRSPPLTVVMYTSLLVLPSASSTGGLDVLASESRMNVVTAADTSPSIVRNSNEDVGLGLLQWVVFVRVAVFVSMLLWIQRRAHYSRRKTQSSLLHLRRLLRIERETSARVLHIEDQTRSMSQKRLRQALERRFHCMKLRIPEGWCKIVQQKREQQRLHTLTMTRQAHSRILHIQK